MRCRQVLLASHPPLSRQYLEPWGGPRTTNTTYKTEHRTLSQRSASMTVIRAAARTTTDGEYAAVRCSPTSTPTPVLTATASVTATVTSRPRLLSLSTMTRPSPGAGRTTKNKQDAAKRPDRGQGGEPPSPPPLERTKHSQETNDLGGQCEGLRREGRGEGDTTARQITNDAALRWWVSGRQKRRKLWVNRTRQTP